ncbi:MAG: acyl-CoA dehydrogenase family protein [Pseudomonadota bacterium]
MNFDLSEEQTLLQASIQRFVRDKYELEQRFEYLRQEAGFSADNYSALAELGLLLLPFSEDKGGLGADPVDIMVACDAIGPGLIAEPFFASSIFTGALFNRLPVDETLVDSVGIGETRFAIAFAERKARYTLDFIETKARPKDGVFHLDGTKTLVLNGDASADLLVLARTSADTMDQAGLSLFHVKASAAGIDRQMYRTTDGNMAAEITFRDTPGTVLGREGEAFEVFEEAVADATFALCAEAVGILQAMFDKTLDYVKERKQFGVPIGSFQVIQHRMSDCYMAVESCRSMVLKAALADRSDRDAWLKTIAGVKAFVSEKSLHVGHECIQFHGGMGVTNELIISHYHKRLMTISTLFGDARTHLERYEMAA